MDGREMNYLFGRPYDVDMVFCIDATGSMGPILDRIKGNAAKLYDDLCERLAIEDRRINQMRVRLIAFRDYADSVITHIPPMMVTDFFTLPEQTEAFKTALTAIEAEGGGDEPEDGLEALGFAMKSKWAEPKPGITRYQIIVLWTDAPAHELGFGKAAPSYTKHMAKDFSELTRWWGYTPDEAIRRQVTDAIMDYEAKRLLLFAPKGFGWSDISCNWCNVIHIPTVTGEGLAEQDYSSIVNLFFMS